MVDVELLRLKPGADRSHNLGCARRSWVVALPSSTGRAHAMLRWELVCIHGTRGLSAGLQGLLRKYSTLLARSMTASYSQRRSAPISPAQSSPLSRIVRCNAAELTCSGSLPARCCHRILSSGCALPTSSALKAAVQHQRLLVLRWSANSRYRGRIDSDGFR